jgi:hypothetical protein
MYLTPVRAYLSLRSRLEVEGSTTQEAGSVRSGQLSHERRSALCLQTPRKIQGQPASRVCRSRDPVPTIGLADMCAQS